MPDVTRLIDRLEHDGLVERERSDLDGRKVVCRLTRRGRGLVDRLDEPVRALHREMLGHIARRDLAKLIELLEQVR